MSYREDKEQENVSKLIKKSIILLLSIISSISAANKKKADTKVTMVEQPVYMDGDTPYTLPNESAKTETKYFRAGEHSVSVPVAEDAKNENIQYEYHEGYKPSGFYIPANSSNPILIYTNEVDVELTTQYIDKNGEYVYINFKEFPRETTTNEYNGIKEFDVGKHIISVPCNEYTLQTDYQFKCPEGYEIVGTSTPSSSKTTILYVNTKKVECEKTDKGYVNFGKVVENSKVTNEEIVNNYIANLTENNTPTNTYQYTKKN